MHMHDNSPGYTQKVSNDLANCVGLRENTVVGIHIRDNLPTSEIVVLEPVMEAEEILKFCTSDHLAHQIGIVHLSMRFPVWRNQNKVGELKVVGALPMATGISLQGQEHMSSKVTKKSRLELHFTDLSSTLCFNINLRQHYLDLPVSLT